MTAVRSHPVTALDEWLFAPETAGRLRVMRLLLAVLLGLRLATGPSAGSRSSRPPSSSRCGSSAGWTRCHRSG